MRPRVSWMWVSYGLWVLSGLYPGCCVIAISMACRVTIRWRQCVSDYRSRLSLAELFPPKGIVEALVKGNEEAEAAPMDRGIVPNVVLLGHAEEYRRKGDTELEAYFRYLADAGPRPSWCVR